MGDHNSQCQWGYLSGCPFSDFVDFELCQIASLDLRRLPVAKRCKGGSMPLTE